MSPKIESIYWSVSASAEAGWSNTASGFVSIKEGEGDSLTIRKAAINVALFQMREKLEAALLDEADRTQYPCLVALP